MHKRIFKQIALGMTLASISFTCILSNNIVWARESNTQYVNYTGGKVTENNIYIKNINISEKSQFIKLEVNYPTIMFKDNRIIQDKINKHFFADALWAKENMLNDAKSAYEDSVNFKYEFRPYDVNIKYEIDKNNNGILSSHSTFYYYTGGAHGTTYIIPYNYRLEDGKELSLMDLFKEGYDYKKIINEKIKEKRDEIDKAYKAEFIKNGGKEGEYKSIFFEDFKGIKDDQKFYITNDDLIIYYDLYEILPYCYGIPKFNIPISSLKDGLNIK